MGVNYQPPQPNQIELNLFGPGFGESVLIHYNSKWISVDSCLNHQNHEPIAITYLKSINVDFENDVKMVISTHWHNDHISGLSKIVKLCKNADFACSSALKSNELLTLIQSYNDLDFGNFDGISEFKSIIDYCKENEKKIILASDDKLIFKDTDISIYSLSPNSVSIISALSEIAKLIPTENDFPVRVKDISPNKASVVLWVRMENINILLGGDLEETGLPNEGWAAILNCKSIEGKASIFKIPHHGSQNAHNSSIWSDLLIKEVYSVLTPYNRLANPLPTRKDIERICSLSKNSYLTADPNKIRKIKRSNVVEKQLKESPIKLKILESSFGHIRIRFTPNAKDTNFNVDLFEDAYKICNN